jgi:hypothetical protein
VSVLELSDALKRRNGYSDKGTSTCASRKSPPLVSSLVGWQPAVCVCRLYQQHQDSSRASYPPITVQHCTALHTVQPEWVDYIILYYSVLKFTVEELVLSLKQHYDLPTSAEPILQPINILYINENK